VEKYTKKKNIEPYMKLNEGRKERKMNKLKITENNFKKVENKRHIERKCAKHIM
jgi:hypothetical protein